MATIETAIRLASIYHAGQKDLAGKSYILHPLRVMANLGLDTTDTERIVAVLHDAVEDTELTLDMLRDEGFSEEIVGAISLVTKVKDKNYDEDAYYRAIMDNPIARRVKIEDLKDNMAPDRLKNKRDLKEKDFVRFGNYVKRYLQLTGK